MWRACAYVWRAWVYVFRAWAVLLFCFFAPRSCRVDLLFWVQLHYLRLPKAISEDYVILMDATVATGAAGKAPVMLSVPDSSVQ